MDRILGDLEQMILSGRARHDHGVHGRALRRGRRSGRAAAGYFEKLQALLARYDILLLADEIVTGFGRTGNMFGCETFGMRPAAITMGKGLTGSYQPVAAIALRGDIYEVLAAESDRIGSFAHGTTYAGYPVGAAVGVRALELMEERDIVGHVRRVAPVFMDRLKRLERHPFVLETRGVGLMGAFQLREGAGIPDAAVFKALAEEAGVIVRAVPVGGEPRAVTAAGDHRGGNPRAVRPPRDHPGRDTGARPGALTAVSAASPAEPRAPQAPRVTPAAAISSGP